MASVAPDLRVLYVDDDDLVRDLVGISLARDPKLELHAAGSGEEALACLASFAPAVILLDVSMPAMDGPEVLKRLRGAHGYDRTPVIFMTARGMAEEREQLMRLGAAAVITKPFDPITLPSDIRAIVQTWQDG
ncbi:response regulator [soil metagenome]